MAVLTREEVGELLCLEWDELTVAQKLLRIRCLIGQTFVDRTPPTEETLSRAEAILGLGVLPENGCGVMLDRHGGVIMGWGTPPSFVVGLELHQDGTSLVETLLPGATSPCERSYPAGALHDAEAARYAVAAMSRWPLPALESDVGTE